MKLAACGNDCELCPRYVATLSEDREELAAVAELWYRAGFRDSIVAPEEIACRGCATARWCRYEVRECAAGKGLAHCGRCASYPCPSTDAMLRRGEEFERVVRDKCSPEEYETLRRAFFEKRNNLGRRRDRH